MKEIYECCRKLGIPISRKGRDPEDTNQEKQRLAFIAKLKQAFPFIDVHWVANQIVPWDIEEFKRQVAERQKEYLKESKQ